MDINEAWHRELGHAEYRITITMAGYGADEDAADAFLERFLEKHPETGPVVSRNRGADTISVTFSLKASGQEHALKLGRVVWAEGGAGSGRALRESATAWLQGAEAGEIRNRSGRVYKPATLRGYRQALEERVLPEFGAQKLSAVTTADLQALVDHWQADGQAASTIRNAIKPLQAIYRRARSREGLALNPTHDLELPAADPTEVEIVAPAVAAQLLEALPAEDRALWATALYTGLRYGELRALRWGAVDLAAGTIRVVESWDPKEGAIAPKTRTSRRTTPVPGLLRDYLIDHRLSAGEPADDELVFAGEDGRPFQATSVYRRADRAWRELSLGRMRLHQARHTYASFMIAAGVNAKALSSFMGHSSINVTFDLYGHLMPGTEAQAAALLDTHLGAEVEAGEQAAREAEPQAEPK